MKSRLIDTRGLKRKPITTHAAGLRRRELAIVLGTVMYSCQNTQITTTTHTSVRTAAKKFSIIYPYLDIQNYRTLAGLMTDDLNGSA